MRAIDADALKKAIEKNGCKYSHYFDIFDVIDDAPTVEERPKGKWIEYDGDHIRAGLRIKMYACDVCGMVGSQTNFCPYCGADMRGDIDGM